MTEVVIWQSWAIQTVPLCNIVTLGHLGYIYEHLPNVPMLHIPTGERECDRGMRVSTTSSSSSDTTTTRRRFLRVDRDSSVSIGFS